MKLALVHCLRHQTCANRFRFLCKVFYDIELAGHETVPGVRRDVGWTLTRETELARVNQ